MMRHRLRLPWRGGNWNNGTNDGACYFNWNTADNQNINYGGRLANLSTQVRIPDKECRVLSILVRKHELYTLQRLVGYDRNLLSVEIRSEKKMPKKWKGRLEDIANLENARVAYWTARSTSKRKDTWTMRRYSSDIVLQALCNEILAENYIPEPPSVWTFVERIFGKLRVVEAPTFQTKIVEHMILNVYGKQILKFIHPNQCGSVPYKGPEYSRKTIKRWSHLPKKQKKYFVQGDIKQFFPSTCRDVAMREYKRHIGDTRVQRLIYRLMPHEIGQCLGNPLVQATENLVFASLMYETLKWTKKVLSQMDDFVALFGNIRKAKAYARHIVEFAKDKMKLVVKTIGKNAIQVWHWKKKAIDISGFVTSYNGYQKSRSHTFLGLRKLLRKESFSLFQARSFMARRGMFKHTDCSVFYEELTSFEQKNHIRYIISKEDKKRNESAA